MQNKNNLTLIKNNFIVHTCQLFKAWSSSVVYKMTRKQKKYREDNSPGLLRGSGWTSLILKKKFLQR